MSLDRRHISAYMRGDISASEYVQATRTGPQAPGPGGSGGRTRPDHKGAHGAPAGGSVPAPRPQAAPGGSRQSGATASAHAPGVGSPPSSEVGERVVPLFPDLPRDDFSENWPVLPIFASERHAPVWLDRLEGVLIVTGLVTWGWALLWGIERLAFLVAERWW